MGITGDYERRQLIQELDKTVLEGRISIQAVNGLEEAKIRRKPSWKSYVSSLGS